MKAQQLEAQDKIDPLDDGQPPLRLKLRPLLELTDDQLLELSAINGNLQLERNAQGELIVMPPAGGESSRRNAEIVIQLGIWTKRNGEGVIFDSSGGFRLADGAVLAPDASWVRRARLENISPEERKKFIPLCPDFVIELRSQSDSLSVAKAKMQEYIDNGAQLGWLIDPQQERAYVYRPQRAIEELKKPATMSGDPELPGFQLDLREIW